MEFFVSKDGLAVKTNEKKYYQIDGLIMHNNEVKPFQDTQLGEVMYYTEDEPIEIDTDGCLDTISYTSVLLLIVILASL